MQTTVALVVGKGFMLISMDGWIKLHRKSLESSVFCNPTVWAVWCWCLVKASYRPQKFPFDGKDLELKEGQFISGQKKGSEECHCTVQKWKTAIRYLKSTNRLTSQPTNKFTVFTILKWNEYQTDNQQNNQPVTNQQPTSNQPVTTIQEVKKLKKDKKISEQARGETFPKEDYTKITESYKTIKGVNPQGKEWLPIQREIKLIFESGRTADQILEAMNVCNSLYDDWTMNTVRMKIADVVSNKIGVEQKGIVIKSSKFI